MGENAFYGADADITDARGLTPRDYYAILSGIWCAETCAPRMRGRWTPENRTLGQCSVTAFLMQDMFGGEVRRIPLEDGGFHCFNAVGGRVFDLTSGQFGGAALDYANCAEQLREVHFADAEKRGRYEYLKQRLEAALAGAAAPSSERAKPEVPESKGLRDLSFIKVGMAQFEAVAGMYARVVEKLERTVNYPKWSKYHPSREYVADSIRRGEQFACVAGGRVIGAVVLNESPEGKYGLGAWSRDLREGEYLVLHILAVDPDYERLGVGGFLVDGSVAFAKAKGYKAVRLDIVPENLPAAELYRSRGFVSAGRVDRLREIEGIPVFEIFELNF